MADRLFLQFAQGTAGGDCWISGSSSGSTCSEIIALSGISEPPGLGPDVQRTFSYGIYAKNIATHGTALWSGWRTLTVGNRTGANFIGFSLGKGNPKNAVDLLFTPHAQDYGATDCSNEPVDPELLNPGVYDSIFLIVFSIPEICFHIVSINFHNLSLMFINFYKC